MGKLGKSICKEIKKRNQNLNSQNIITFSGKILKFTKCLIITLIKKIW